MTGVNLDHEDFFRILKEDLRREVTPHIASLRLAATGADGASLSQKAIVQITVAQLMHITCSLHSMDDGETEEEELNIKKASLILPTLAAWYSNQYPDFTSSPKKQVKTTTGNSGLPPLIIILEDFESFSPVILQDFIMNIL